nr:MULTISPECIES: phosphatase PAP2 family protein [unclassified Gemella]
MFIAISFNKGIFFGIDFEVWEFITNIRNELLNKIIINFTHLGDSYFLFCLVAIVSIILIFKYGNYKEAIWLIITTLFGAAILNKLLKNYYARPRPFVDDLVTNLVDVTGYSFPSGHSMGSTIVYLSITYIIVDKVNNSNIRYIIYTFSIMLSIFICFSRVYLGVHYPTDVIVGYFLALSWVVMSGVVNNLLKDRGNNN